MITRNNTWHQMVLTGVLLLAPPAIGAEPTAETVLDNLRSPCGVAVQPGTEHVFVSETGAGQVIRWADGKAQPIITGFPTRVRGDGRTLGVGPLGLTFQDPNTLIVAGRGTTDGQELAQVYSLPQAGGLPLSASQPKGRLGPLSRADPMKQADGFRAVAATPAAVYVGCSGDVAGGYLARVDIQGSNAGQVRSFPATENAMPVTPACLTISPRGEVVIGQMGQPAASRDGRLSFFNAYNGRLLLDLETGLFDMTGIAYRQPHLLYALDFAQADAPQGGLFRLDAIRKGGRQAVRAVKIASLHRPTAMAFARDGTLYVTLLGTAGQGEDRRPGRLVKLAPSVTDEAP